MGIDGIGKKVPAAAPPPEKETVGHGAESGRAFEVTSPREASPVLPAATIEPPPTALERCLRNGEIDLRGYLDLKVSEATAHLTDLPASALEAIQSALRDRMASDPTLVELVRTATGRVPEPRGDD